MGLSLKWWMRFPPADGHIRCAIVGVGGLHLQQSSSATEPGMGMRKRIGILLVLTATAALGQGNNCDCQQYTGNCEASITVVPTQSTKGSYGADLQIRSTAPQCAKVDYVVDGTPYFTILSQGNHGEDRVFGTRPITRANVTDVSCRVCRRTDAPTVQPAPPASASSPTVAGRWHAAACPGAPGWWGSGGPSRDVTMSLSLNGTSVSGAFDDKSADYAYSATLSGTTSPSAAKLTSSVGSVHAMTLSADGQSLSDRWCNKDGGCAVCVMQRQ